MANQEVKQKVQEQAECCHPSSPLINKEEITQEYESIYQGLITFEDAFRKHNANQYINEIKNIKGALAKLVKETIGEDIEPPDTKIQTARQKNNNGMIMLTKAVSVLDFILCISLISVLIYLLSSSRSGGFWVFLFITAIVVIGISGCLLWKCTNDRSC